MDFDVYGNQTSLFPVKTWFQLLSCCSLCSHAVVCVNIMKLPTTQPTGTWSWQGPDLQMFSQGPWTTLAIKHKKWGKKTKTSSSSVKHPDSSLNHWSLIVLSVVSAEPCGVLPQRATRVHSGTSALHAAASGLRTPRLQKLQQDALLPHQWELQPGPGYEHTHLQTTSSAADTNHTETLASFPDSFALLVWAVKLKLRFFTVLMMKTVSVKLFFNKRLSSIHSACRVKFISSDLKEGTSWLNKRRNCRVRLCQQQEVQTYHFFMNLTSETEAASQFRYFR